MTRHSSQLTLSQSADDHRNDRDGLGRARSSSNEPSVELVGTAALFASFTVLDRVGCEARFRPLVAGDRPTVIRLFPELSAQTRFHRFNSLYETLSDAQLLSLFDLDYRYRFAWAVELTCDGRITPVAVGRYARYAGSRRADVALTIRDEWQGRGLGGSLLDALIITAHHHGLIAFDTVVTADNEPMLHLLRERGGELAPSSANEVDVVLPFAVLIDTLTEHPLMRMLTARDHSGLDRRSDGDRAVTELLTHDAAGGTP